MLSGQLVVSDLVDVFKPWNSLLENFNTPG